MMFEFVESDNGAKIKVIGIGGGGGGAAETPSII
jgi:cell division GTPase FtsZ